MDSNAARLFEVGFEAGLGDGDVGACVGEDEAGTAGVRRGVEADGCCLPSGMLIDTR